MPEEPTPEAVAAARAYEELFVPALFHQWPPMILSASGISAGDRVLDVGCGTGVLARAMATHLGDPSSVHGVDPAPGMLAVARELGPGIQWHEASADQLPFDDASFDSIASQFAMMFFPDPVAALTEMRRVLKPGGRIALAVWDDIENNEAYAREAALLERLAGSEAAEAIRLPYRLGDSTLLSTWSLQAGFLDTKVTTHQDVARFPSLQVQLEAELRGWLPLMGVHLEESKIEEILRAAEEDLGEFVDQDGKTKFPVSAHLIIAKKG